MTAELVVGEPFPSPTGQGRNGDDWFTPRWLFDQLGVTFELDVCAPINPEHRTCPARRYYTEMEDGLARPWEGLVWCNPPYSDSGPWVERWAEHDSGLILTHFSVKARRMPELWDAAEAFVLFAGMDFVRPDGKEEKPYWGIQLAARGTAAIRALANVSNEWASPMWGRFDG